jgi:hypothetical protein
MPQAALSACPAAQVLGLDSIAALLAGFVPHRCAS